MGIQSTDWGQIEWMENKEEGVFREGMKVGIVTMKPGSHHPPHRHYDEQVNYVISGQGESYINGKMEILKPGKFVHWGVGVTHEVYNRGEVPFVHFMISNPAGQDLDNFFLSKAAKSAELSEKEQHARREKNQNQEQKDGKRDSLLLQAIDAVRVQFLEPVQCPYSIFDKEGVMVSQGKFFPAYCRKKCSGRSGDPRVNPCMAAKNENLILKDCEFLCPYCLTVLNVPISFEGQFIGYIQGGYFWKSSNGKTDGMTLYDTPESTAFSMHNLLQSVSKAIENYCEFQYYQENLEEKNRMITREEETKKILMQDLKEAEYTVTDLRINHHFLFNTLNCMAVQAIDAQAPGLYQSIQSLAKMFQYTLRTNAKKVPLSREMEYVKAYLQLQKLRYKEHLEVMYDVDDSVLDVEIPFNFLQPVVENIFVHGFHDMIEKKMWISAGMNEGFLEIIIGSSGKGLKEEEYKRINQEILENQVHGLSLVNYKLKAVCGEQSSLKIELDEDGRSRFRIRIPAENRENKETDGKGRL